MPKESESKTHPQNENKDAWYWKNTREENPDQEFNLAITQLLSVMKQLNLAYCTIAHSADENHRFHLRLYPSRLICIFDAKYGKLLNFFQGMSLERAVEAYAYVMGPRYREILSQWTQDPSLSQARRKEYWQTNLISHQAHVIEYIYQQIEALSSTQSLSPRTSSHT